MAAVDAANPCIARYGAGPPEARCGSCLHLRAARLVDLDGGRVVERTSYYCGLTDGPRRVTAPACARFEEAYAAELAGGA